MCNIEEKREKKEINCSPCACLLSVNDTRHAGNLSRLPDAVFLDSCNILYQTANSDFFHRHLLYNFSSNLGSYSGRHHRDIYVCRVCHCPTKLLIPLGHLLQSRYLELAIASEFSYFSLLNTPLLKFLFLLWGN